MTRETDKYIFRVVSVAILVVTSCSGNITYTENYLMKDKTWQLADIKSFDVQIADTLALNDIFFTIRTGADYPFRNIFLSVSAFTPDGKITTDTIEYYIADEKGNRLGKGFGDVRELKLPYLSNFYFQTKGEYKFEVQHVMKTGDLQGVYDIGLRIEKTQH